MLVEPERWRQISSLLDRVLELPREDRAAYVEDACRGDPDLRAQVEAFLAADEQSSGLLDKPAVDHLARLATATGTGMEAGSPGLRLGPYELVRPLGQGGMGVVWEALDVRLGRRVAVKLLPESRGYTAATAERFLREARAASALDHPSLCTVHDICVGDDGQLFLVMAFYAGETLEQKMARGPLPIGAALDLAIQVGRGLEAAHRAGIVHRDIKPANVVVTDEGVAKVLDFGISRIAGEEALTRTGATPGTPVYMSPEQVSGGPVDGRSDLWSLAVTLYEMIAGRRPFAGDTTEAVLYAIVHREPEPLRRRGGEIPPRLVRVLARALAKSPAARHPSAAALVADLAAVQAGLEPSRSRPWTLLRRLGWIAAGLTLASLAGTAVAPGSRQTIDRAAAPRAASPYALYQEGRELLRFGYRRGNPERAVALFQDALRGDDRHAPAYAGLAEAHLWLFARERDRSLVGRAQENAELAVRLDGRLARAQVALASVLVAQGKAEEAVRHFEEALRLDPRSVAAHRELGNALHRLGRLSEAEREMVRAAELDPADWLTQERLALFAYRRGDHPAAERAFGRALALAEDNPGLHNNLAAVYSKQGKYEEALAELQRSLEIDPLDRTYTNLGTLQFFLGRFRAALGSFERAIELGANQYLNWGNLGDACRWTGQTARAREAYTRALQLLAPELAAAPRDATLVSRRALYLAKRGEPVQALREIAALQPLPPGEAELAYRYAVVCELAGARDKALSGLASALAAGYPPEEIRRDPELFELRKDPRYHRIALPFTGGGSSGG